MTLVGNAELEQQPLGLRLDVKRGKDLFLCHTGVDKAWVETLAERVETERFDDRYLGVVFDKWDFGKGSNIVLDIEREIDACRFVGVVVTRALLTAEWPTLERTIAVWSDPSGARGRVIPILRENVTLPASLRIRNWIDFRDDEKFNEALQELLRVLRGEPAPRGRGSLKPNIPPQKVPYEPAPIVITSSVAADIVNERIVSNLLPVVELPATVYSAETHCRTKADVTENCEEELPVFILREGRLYTFERLTDMSLFSEAIELKSIRAEPFDPWFEDVDRSRWAIELLNVSLKQHARRRFLRFDRDGRRYFFAPHKNRPKRISWRLGSKWSSREVTTPHNIRKVLEDGTVADIQIGWRQQGFRASFVRLPFGLFLIVEPTWLLTGPDGRKPRGGPRVGPILSHWLNQERNGQVLRSVRFWSLVLARGHSDIKISAGDSSIRVGLTPASGTLGFGIIGDSIDYDQLMRAEIEDDIAVPQLSLFSEEALMSEPEGAAE